MADSVALGVQAAQARRPAEAVRWFRMAVAEKPGDVRVRSWLGQALCASGEQLEGVAVLKDVALRLARSPTAPARAPAIAIAVELQRLTAVAESLEVIDVLLRADPRNPQIAYIRATALGQLNRPADALKAGQAAAALAGANPAATLLLASLEHDAKMDDAASARLDGLLAVAPPPREAYRAHKLRAAILDRRGAHADAFAALAAAERIAPQVPDLAALDRALIPRVLDEARAGYTPELMARFAGHAFGDRAPPVFVVGFFRSGTTMMQQILASHPRAFVADEAPLVQAAIGALHMLDPSPRSIPAKLAGLDVDGVARLRDAYWAAARGRFGEAAVAGPVFVDKFTMNTIEMGFISTIFPDARVIFMVRDPRDACISAYMQQMPPSAATAHLLDWTATARFYAAVMDWWLAVRPMLSLRWCEVRYEDLVEDFEGTLRPALATAGLEWDEALTRFHERAAGRFVSTPSRLQVGQPLYRSALARWRRYEAQVAPVAPVLAPYITAFGYPAV
ncbi:tetratricopeptide repeat-containing sulfotransferase family protein [Sphingomonas sp. RS2018]